MTAKSATPVITEQWEAYYEVPWRKKKPDGVERGTFRIYDADDPRWDGELMEAPYKGDPQGYLNVQYVKRLDGEIVGTPVNKKGKLCHMNTARAFIRQHNERRAQGDDRPFDQYTAIRDAVAAAEQAQAEGNARLSADLRDLLTNLATTPAGAQS